jgi:hypothetical protein
MVGAERMVLALVLASLGLASKLYPRLLKVMRERARKPFRSAGPRFAIAWSALPKHRNTGISA